MKPKLIFNALVDLPANAPELSASMPERAVNDFKEVPAPAARRTQAEIHAARQRSTQFAPDLWVCASTPFDTVTPWQRGGINE